MARLINIIKKSMKKKVDSDQSSESSLDGGRQDATPQDELLPPLAEPQPQPAAVFDEPPKGENPYRRRLSSPSDGSLVRAHWERVNALQELYRELFAAACFSLKGVIDHARTVAMIGKVVDVFEAEPYNELMLMAYTFSRKNYLAAHIVNDVVLTIGFAQRIGYGRRELVDLGICAFTHDLGMVGFDGTINKNQRLSVSDIEDIKAHPLVAAEMVRPIFSEKIASVIMDIHERENGQGYPRGIPGAEIHMWAKVISMCDTFEALTHPRIFRAPYSPYEAMKIIIKKKDVFFDDVIVKRFIDFMSIYPVGMCVYLNTGETAMVIGSNAGSPTRPVVRILVNQNREVEDLPRTIDLAHQDFGYICGVVNPEKEKEIHYFLNPRGQVELDEA